MCTGLSELRKEAATVSDKRYQKELQGVVSRLEEELLNVHHSSARLILHAEGVSHTRLIHTVSA